MCVPLQRERAVPPAPGNHPGQGADFYPLTALPVSSWHHLMSISIFSLPWVGIPTSDPGESRQSVLELSLAMTGEEKCNSNKCCAVHSVPGINCSVVASFGGAAQKAVKASKKSQRTRCWGMRGGVSLMACMDCQANPLQTSASSVAHSHCDTEATFIGCNS